ncbi:hypothetical protein B0H16DRAFT_1792771 [Mycena metata]|uniref:Uncharacterized protein n=1 Tax=Mycena metata TaxID=1033252 RepID=A0AAD7JJ82_9AGAR|nr:hypothetical protein B0H16DRAFT_1792771 [Mycena metata]
MLSVAKILVALTLASASLETPTPHATNGTGDVFYYKPDSEAGACGWMNTTDQAVATVSNTTFNGFPGATPKNPNTNPICGRRIVITGNNVTINAFIVDYFEQDKNAGPNDVGVTKPEFMKMAPISAGIVRDAVWNITM